MSNQLVEILRCRIGKQTFGLQRNYVQSVQHGNRIEITKDKSGSIELSLPTTQGTLMAMCLATYLNESCDLTPKEQRLLVLRGKWGLWCMLVDEVSQAQFVSADSIQPLPKVAQVHFAQSIYNDGKETLLMLEPDNMHPNAEISAEISLPDYTQLNLENIQPKSQGHLVLFKMPGEANDNQQYAVGLTPKQIDQVLRNPEIKPVPTAPNYLMGVVSWRGRLVPVLDLGQRLGLHANADASFSKQDRVVIMHGLDSEKMVGFYADPRVDIVTLPAPHSSLPDIQVDETLIYGAARYSGQNVLIPHVENLSLTA